MHLTPLAALLAATLALAPPAASAFETAAREALVIDDGTGMVMFEKNADTPIPPASMSKLMTLYMLFEALRNGWRREPSWRSNSANSSATGRRAAWRASSATSALYRPRNRASATLISSGVTVALRMTWAATSRTVHPWQSDGTAHSSSERSPSKAASARRCSWVCPHTSSTSTVPSGVPAIFEPACQDGVEEAR
jgi:D-alanyl-D-alanine carboxypeptidase